MKKILFVLTLIFAFTISYAQNKENVSWTFSSKTLSNGNIELLFNAVISDGFRLYSPYNPQGASMPLTITLDENNAFTTDNKIIELQKPEEHYEEIFDATEKFFKGKASFKIIIKPTENKDFTVSGSLKGQACDEQFMCTMVRKNFSINVTAQKKKQQTVTKPIKKDSIKPKTKQEKDTVVINSEKKDSVQHVETIPISEQQQPNNQIIKPVSEDSLPKIFFIAFLAGLAAIFTPCVFPMIPMTVTYFLKDKSGKGKFHALIYGLSIILLYTLPVAILLILSNLLGGENFTASIFNLMSTHWLPNILFFIIFFIFALSFLGMFEIVMPSSLINKAEQRGDKGGLIGIFFLAFVLVLVSFSCTGPIVGSVLVESTSGGNFLKPITAMFGFSLAFAMPFTLFAFFPDIMKKLPKSGGWLNTVKVVLGFVELALGMKFLSVVDQTYHWHILDRETYLSIWIAIGIMLFLYLIGKLKLPHDNDLEHIKVPRILLSISTLSFIVYLIPGLFGAPLKALAGYIPPITTQDFVMTPNNVVTDNQSTLCKTPKYSDKLSLPFGIKAYFEYDEALECAKNMNKPLLLIFTGHGCVNCRKMEENVWSDSRVQNIMKKDYIICALYTDDRTLSEDGKHTIGEINSQFQEKQFHINAQPYYVIINPLNPNVPTKQPMAYNPDVESFINYLK